MSSLTRKQLEDAEARRKWLVRKKARLAAQREALAKECLLTVSSQKPANVLVKKQAVAEPMREATADRSEGSNVGVLKDSGVGDIATPTERLPLHGPVPRKIHRSGS